MLEGLLIAVALAFASYALSSRRLGRGARPAGFTVLAICTLVSGAGSWLIMGFKPADEYEFRVYPLESPEDGYVGSQTCRSCHPGEYGTWHSSYHRSMTLEAAPESVNARGSRYHADKSEGRAQGYPGPLKAYLGVIYFRIPASIDLRQHCTLRVVIRLPGYDTSRAYTTPAPACWSIISS